MKKILLLTMALLIAFQVYPVNESHAAGKPSRAAIIISLLGRAGYEIDEVDWNEQLAGHYESSLRDELQKENPDADIQSLMDAIQWAEATPDPNRPGWSNVILTPVEFMTGKATADRIYEDLINAFSNGDRVKILRDLNLNPDFHYTSFGGLTMEQDTSTSGKYPHFYMKHMGEVRWEEYFSNTFKGNEVTWYFKVVSKAPTAVSPWGWDGNKWSLYMYMIDADSVFHSKYITNLWTKSYAPGIEPDYSMSLETLLKSPTRRPEYPNITNTPTQPVKLTIPDEGTVVTPQEIMDANPVLIEEEPEPLPIPEPEDKPLGSSWWDWLLKPLFALVEGISTLLTSLINLVTNLAVAIADAIGAIFVPSEGFFDGFFNEIKSTWDSKIPIISQLSDFMSTVESTSTETAKPVIEVTLPPQYGGVTMSVIDFTYFDQYREWILNFIRFTAWFIFLKRLWARLPRVIGG